MRPEKQQLVQDIQAILGKSESLFLITYKGLTAAQFADLRGRLAGVGSECHVIPNRLFKRAARDTGITALTDVALAGDNACVTGGTDTVGVAKILKTYAKENEKVTVRLAVVDGTYCDAAGAAQLADLPAKEVLQAQLLSLLQAPARQLVGVLHAKLASVVYVLNAYLKEKEQAA